MAITGAHINNKLKVLLQDDTNIRWEKSEICGWINSAQREILIHKPNANPTFGVIDTAIGTSQQIPAGGIQLLDIIRNMGSDGQTPGKVITNIPRAVVDRQTSWHKSTTYVTPTVGADHYTYDERFPTRYYLWPGLTAVSKVEAVYSALPIDLTYTTAGDAWTMGLGSTTVGTGTGLIFNDIYETPIIDYCAYRCYSKDADYTGNATRALAFYQAFMAAVTGKTKAEIGVAPVSNLDSKAA